MYIVYMCVNVFYLQYVKRKHPRPETGQFSSFKFVQRDSTPTLRGDYIELKFDTPQDYPTTGWTIKPQAVPCIVSTCIMYELMCVYQ